MSNRIHSNESAMFGLWLNWVIALGALTLPNLVSVYCSATTVITVTFTLMALLWLFNNLTLRSERAVCPLVPGIALRTLGMTGVIMLIITMFYHHGYASQVYDPQTLNQEIPFLTILIISPSLLFVSIWSKLRGHSFSTCRSCLISLGPECERGFIGKIFGQESNYQRKFLMGISSVCTAVVWTYYFLFYINVNINTPDQFFFGWFPVILYLVSVVYLATRYFTIWAYYFQRSGEGGLTGYDPTTTARYLIICEDSIYLTHDDDYSDIPDARHYDTPTAIKLNHRERMNLDRARTIFSETAQLPDDDFSIRFMYFTSDSTGVTNVFHYIVCPASREAMEKSEIKGKWYNLSQVERLLHNDELSPAFQAEFSRLYTVTMAWKTYDAHGRRLYKVKNYQPVFRLKGICDWDVDFNSPKWLNVARFNQDKPFYRLRRYFHNFGQTDK